MTRAITPPQIVTLWYDVLLYILPQIAKFPRTYRYQLGERLNSVCCDVLELLLTAAYARDKSPLLHRANLKLEQSRYYLRLCKDLRLMSVHPYEVASKMLYEVGKQLGGSIMQQQRKP